MAGENASQKVARVGGGQRHTARRFLRKGVEHDLVPIFEAQGFQRVRLACGDRDWPVRNNEIRLERLRSDAIDYVSIGFHKWTAPRFHINFGRSLLTEPHHWVKSANLVAHPSEYYHVWGKPWWMPLWVWSESDAERTVRTVVEKIDQAFVFLDTDVRGRNVSRAILPMTSGEKWWNLARLRAIAVVLGLACMLVPLLTGHDRYVVLAAYTTGEVLAFALIAKPASEVGWIFLAAHLVLSFVWVVAIWNAFL